MKLQSGNQKIQYGRQTAILKVTPLKINRRLPMATINLHMKFEIEIPKQTWLMVWKPCRTDGWTDGRTDGRTRWIQYTPPSNSVGRGYNQYTPPPTPLGGGINIYQKFEIWWKHIQIIIRTPYSHEWAHESIRKWVKIWKNKKMEFRKGQPELVSGYPPQGS